MASFSENALILVAILPSLRDFEIARLLGWYRIPLRMAPKIVDVDYLAFYQTGSFADKHRWMIEHFAEVRGHELTTRVALLREEPDHPRAKEEYYKIQIGAIQKMDPSIPAGKWKRITFFYTLGSLINQASVINDLVVKSEDRDLLWKCLRERNRSYATHSRADQMELFSEEELLSILSQLGGMTEPPDFSDI